NPASPPCCAAPVGSGDARSVQSLCARKARTYLSCFSHIRKLIIRHAQRTEIRRATVLGPESMRLGVGQPQHNAHGGAEVAAHVSGEVRRRIPSVLESFIAVSELL